MSDAADTVDLRDEAVGETDSATDRPTLAASLEALLLVADQTVTSTDLATFVGEPVAEVEQELVRLAAGYRKQRRGFDLRNVADGWRFYTAPECAELVGRYAKDGQAARLTQAALETLAVVAYRQPVSRARVGAIRGVNVDAVMRTLATRGLVTEVETDTATGAVLYGTTQYFLERMGLRGLDELPPIADYLPDLSVLDELVDPRE